MVEVKPSQNRPESNELPRLLLITRHLPGQVEVGPVFLRDLFRLYPQDRLFWFHIAPQDPFEQSPEFDRMITRLGEGTFTHIRSPKIPFWRNPSSEGLLKEVIEFGSEHSIDLVWAAMDSPETVSLAVPVAEALGVKLITMVWDPPEYKIERWGVKNTTGRRILLDCFERALRRADRCGVASPRMAEVYEERFGTDCVVLIRGVPQADKFIPPAPLDERTINIGYAGSFYATPTWQSFTKALDDIKWTLDNRRIALHVMGPGFTAATRSHAEIRYWGWLDAKETVALLSQMQLAYLPYWFEDTFKTAVELSFPNKLATYIAAGIPTLYHGPLSSSPTRFFRDYPAGIGCHSTDPSDILDALTLLVSDTDLIERAKKACAAAYLEMLSPAIFRKNFARLLGVEQSALAPIVST